MNLCKTCKHWDEKTVEERDEVEDVTYGGRHYCFLLSDKDNEGFECNSDNDIEAAAHGIGGASITSGPNFGCIHHESK